jgi:hypothetical protein
MLEMLVRGNIGTDADTMNYIKEMMPLATCIEFRDLLCGAVPTPGTTNVQSQHQADERFVKHCVEHRGSVVCAVMEALLAVPDQPMHRPLISPIIAAAVRNFDRLYVQQRGCIAFLRLLTAATP